MRDVVGVVRGDRETIDQMRRLTVWQNIQRVISPPESSTTSSFTPDDLRFAFSTGFQNQQMGVGSIHRSIQSQAVRDPMEQQRFERQMRALEAVVGATNMGNATLNSMLTALRQLSGFMGGK